jgi:GNAT superfamily N-acetyltransferase
MAIAGAVGAQPSWLCGWQPSSHERHLKISEQFQIRLATPADAETIGWHRARMFQDMGKVPPHLFEELCARSRERLREYLTTGEYIGWLASTNESPGKIIAGAGVQLRQVLPHPLDHKAVIAEGRHALLLNVFTEPEWRRRGIATLLIRQIITWSRDQQLDRLVLHASDEGRAVYERLGFIATNEMRLDPS